MEHLLPQRELPILFLLLIYLLTVVIGGCVMVVLGTILRGLMLWRARRAIKSLQDDL